MSNFSFYYAHHMSTIEGGMICTNDSNLYEILRMLRSHGMVRETKSAQICSSPTADEVPGSESGFHFCFSGLQCAQHRDQRGDRPRLNLKRLDENN